MKLWQELLSTAIVGTERQKFVLSPNGYDELSEVLQAVETNDNETALLKTAGVLTVYRQAGIQISADEEPLADAALAENALYLNSNSAGHLAAMLAGNYADALAEFFVLAEQHKQILPPQFLPEILDLGNQNRDLRSLILPIIGERGRWLARHNDAWHWALIEENAAEIWQSGTRGERLFALEFLRWQKADAARELLAADWKGESARDRAAFLETLLQNLSEADEPFLDEVLRSDKSSEARQTVFDLLARLPNSRLVKELSERAAKILAFKKGGFLSKPKIEISLSADFGNLGKNDILQSAGADFSLRDFGAKALNLTKILSAIPPDYWENVFNVNAKTLIETALSNEWAKSLLLGWAIASHRHLKTDWIKEFVNLAYSGNQLFSVVELRLAKIVESLPGQEIEDLIWRLIKENALPKLGISPTLELLGILSQKSYQWSDDFARRIFAIAGNNDPICKDVGKFFVPNLVSYLPNFAHSVSPLLADEFSTNIFTKAEETNHLDFRSYSSSKNKFLTVLQFRREIRDSFEQEK